MRARSTLVTIHLWLGLTLGFFWALQGLTGALLVFNRDAERWSLHETASGPVLPLDAIFAGAARQAKAPVNRLETLGPSRTLFAAYFDDPQGHQRIAVIDGRSGRVRDWRDPETLAPSGGSSWRWLLRLHEALLMGDRGGALVGASGLVLLSSLTLGAVLGWPRAGAWPAAVRASRWRSVRQRLFGWHRLAGIVLLAPLAVGAATGAYLALAPEIRPVLMAHAGYRAPFKPPAVKTKPARRISAQQALDAARAAYPGAVLVRATLPSAKSFAYTFRLLQPAEPRRWAGTTTVAVDPVSGRILDTYDALRGPLANQITDDLYPVHTGEIGGVALRLLSLLAGLSLPTLYVTGVWAWLHRRRLTARREAGRP